MANPIPEGMHALTPQLNVDGAAAAIEFYKKAFGATEKSRAPDPSGKKIWHAELAIGDSVLFVNDTFPEMGGSASVMTLWLYTANVDAAFERAVAAGAKVKMPLADMFWGDRMGQVTDQWGTTWCLSQHTRDMSREEMQRAGEAFAKQQR